MSNHQKNLTYFILWGKTIGLDNPFQNIACDVFHKNNKTNRLFDKHAPLQFPHRRAA